MGTSPIKDLAKEAWVNIPTLRAMLAFIIAHTMKIDLIQDAEGFGLLRMNSSEAPEIAVHGGRVLRPGRRWRSPKDYPLW